MRFQARLAWLTVFVALLIDMPRLDAASPDACDLLHPKLAASLFGAPLRDPLHLDRGTACVYSARSGDGNVNLDLTEAQGMTVSQYRITKGSALQGQKAESIPGLGEESFMILPGPGKSHLSVFYHQKIVVLGVDRSMTPQLRTEMIDAMKQILARL